MKNERNNLELKRQVLKSFLKTVSAYANYTDGEIQLFQGFFIG